LFDYQAKMSILPVANISARSSYELILQILQILMKNISGLARSLL
jgi:hypothetical protein